MLLAFHHKVVFDFFVLSNKKVKKMNGSNLMKVHLIRCKVTAFVVIVLQLCIDVSVHQYIHTYICI